MKPYYQDDDKQITIYHGDAREILPTLEAGTVDLVLTDPPYGETSLEWDTAVDDWLPLLPRILSPAGSLWCFGSLAFFMDQAATFADWNKAQEIVWEKHNGSSLRTDRFRRVHELVVHLYHKGTRWADLYKDPQFTMDASNVTVRRKTKPAHFIQDGAKVTSFQSHDGGPRHMRSVQFVRSTHGYAVHPTQKPEGIVRPPLLYSCPPGGLIVDPFFGSGTTGAVARQEGRRCIGIDIKEENCEIAVNRLSQQVLDLTA
jgi:DNA modification methylase